MSDGDGHREVAGQSDSPHPPSLPRGLRPGFFGLGLFSKAQRDFGDTALANMYEPQGGLREWTAYVKEAFIRVYTPPTSSAYRAVKGVNVAPLMLHRTENGEIKAFPYGDENIVATAGIVILCFFGIFHLLEYTMLHLEAHKPTMMALWIAYGLLGGWILSPIMNIIKLFTELLPKLFAEFFACLRHSTDHPMLSFLAGIFHVGFELIYVVMRMVTSPMESAKAGFHGGYDQWSDLLGILSIVGSLTLWTGIAFVAGPLLLLSISTKLGISLSALSHSGSLTVLSSPVMTFLTTQLHFVATTALTGAVTLSTGVITLLGFNELRKGLSELLVKVNTAEKAETDYLSCCRLSSTYQALE